MSEEQKQVEPVQNAEEPVDTKTETPHHHAEAAKRPKSETSRLDQFKTWYGQHKKWTIPSTVALVLIAIFAIPFSRYALAGLVVKQDFIVSVVDATANTPVSGATISIGPITAQTDGTGRAKLHNVKPGHHQITINKKYYQSRSAKLVVPILDQKSVPQVQMTATGRQVKITITNTINQKRLSEVSIVISGVTAKTDKEGSAIVVLPVGVLEQKAKLSLSGFNDVEVAVKVSNDKIQENNFTLTPNGKVYFLSKLSGKVDVVKTNLDGTDRQTVLGGTGKEDDRGTVLLASRDWKYLALLSKRAGSSAALYLIDTSNDKLSTIDDSDTLFTPAGWVNDSFIYTVTKNGTQLWQPNRQVLKSFDATARKLITLDQTTASGTNQFDYITELMGSVYASNEQILYIKNWTAAYSQASSADFTSKQATFNGIKADGSGKKAIKSFGLAAGTTAIDISAEDRVENPGSIDIKFSDGTKDSFYNYANGQVKDEPTGTSDSFYRADYPTYLQSPSGDNTFWAESRDGKYTLFVGDQSGQDGKQIATLSDYFTYGWFTDNYLLVSKNSSELYIIPKTGSKTPVKISDYHKPSATFYGYGGGYGGL